MPEKITDQFNISRQCRRYGLLLWQCPQFLFLVMGAIIVGASLFSFFIGSRYISDLGIVALVDILITAILFIISFVITRSFEKLAEISRMKSEFINIVTHQLRAPLTNLRWAVDFLTSKEWEGDKEKEEEYYSGLKENVGRMSELVDDLLVVSRLQQDTIPFRKKEISLEDMIKEMLLRFGAFADASNIEIIFNPKEDTPSVFADPSQIKLVVENLIDNAIRYTKGGGKIEINLEKRGKRAYFSITDQGVGIPEHDQKFIFQKFFRSENAMRDQTRGSGLGLFIAKTIIEKSDGEIGFESKDSKGTVFYFYLPIK